MLRDNEDDKTATEPEFVRALLKSNGPDADSDIVRSHAYTFHALVADKWNTRRIFLAGDAAHLSPPFAGQGMNSGIRDAFNLGWKLGAVVRAEFGTKPLETYFEEREPHARELIQLAVSMGRVMMPRSSVQALLVQSGFRLARLLPKVHAYFTQMKYKPKPYYRRGLVDSKDAMRLAGRMLPQPLIETGDGRKMLFDELLGNDFCWVAYGPDAQELLSDPGQLDFGRKGLRLIAITPPVYNLDRSASAEITGGPRCERSPQFVAADWRVRCHANQAGSVHRGCEHDFLVRSGRESEESVGAVLTLGFEMV